MRLGPTYNIHSLGKILQAANIGDTLVPAECPLRTPQYHNSLLHHLHRFTALFIGSEGAFLRDKGSAPQAEESPQPMSCGGDGLICPLRQSGKGVAAPPDLLCPLYSF